MHYLYPVFYGISAGFLMSVLLGAVFFMLINTGLKHSYKKAYYIAAGVVTGDLLFVILSIQFTAVIKEFIKQNQLIISIAGGLVLITIGIVNILKRHKATHTLETKKYANLSDFYLKPLVVNLLNPANVIWWLGLYAAKPAADYDTPQKMVFGIAAILTVFWTEIAVAYSAQKLKKYTNDLWIKRIDVTVGIVFILIGISMIVRNLSGHI